VCFADTASVDKAVKLTGEVLKGRPLRVTFARPKEDVLREEGRPAQATMKTQKEKFELFVKFIPLTASDNDVKEFFQDYGPSAVRLWKDREGTAKGACWLEFANKEEAERCKQECDDAPFEDRHLDISWATEWKKNDDKQGGKGKGKGDGKASGKATGKAKGKGGKGGGKGKGNNRW